MERCDFCSVMRIITEYLSETKAPNHTELVYLLFSQFVDEHDDFDFDSDRINRWLKGREPVSPKITAYYTREGYFEYLASDIEEKVFPLMTNSDMAAQRIYDLLMNDVTVSEQKKNALTDIYSPQNTTDTADLMQPFCFSLWNANSKRTMSNRLQAVHFLLSFPI